MRPMRCSSQGAHNRWNEPDDDRDQGDEEVVDRLAPQSDGPSRARENETNDIGERGVQEHEGDHQGSHASDQMNDP